MPFGCCCVPDDEWCACVNLCLLNQTVWHGSSQVYSADMFYSIFAKDPMNAKEGRRYRHTVLERGGSQDEMRTLEDFLGRKPSTEAFYRELGLAR